MLWYFDLLTNINNTIGRTAYHDEMNLYKEEGILIPDWLFYFYTYYIVIEQFPIELQTKYQSVYDRSKQASSVLLQLKKEMFSCVLLLHIL